MLPEEILIGAVILLASILQGVFGFAFMLIALPLLSFFVSMKVAVPLLSFFLALLSGILAFRFREEFDFKNIRSPLIGAIVGIPLGVFFLIAFNDRLIKTVLGILLLVYSTHSLFNRSVFFRFPSWTGYIAGFFAGALGGAFNITGPPIVFYISTQQWNKSSSVGALNFFFCITSILVLFFHLVIGNITKEIAVAFLKLIPVMIAGMLMGVHIFKKVNEENYRKGLFVLLIIMGVMLLF
jgi:uncharacterized membrane protein YfcA